MKIKNWFKNFFIKIKNDKRLMIILCFIIVGFLALIVRISYAFLTTDFYDSDEADMDIETSADQLKFSGINKINRYINIKDNTAFSETINAKATLIVNEIDDEHYLSEKYYAYVDITNNFIYSIGFNKPEIIMKVIGPRGELTSLPGLNYKTNVNGTGFNGFDITTINGIIPLTANNSGSIISISKSGTKKEEEWSVTIKFIKYNDIHQNKNGEKTLDLNLILQKDKINI